MGQVVSSAVDSRQSFELLVKVLGNVLASPGNPKFREVRKANASVQSAIVANAACAMLLRRCGFRDEGDVFRVQKSGMRYGEVARLCCALAEYLQYQNLAQNLADAAGIPLSFAPALQAQAAEASRQGRDVDRPGWTEFPFCDADPGQDLLRSI